MTLQRNPDIVWRVEKKREAEVVAALERGEDAGDQGTVILILSGMMHQLNYAGALIWRLCDGTLSDEQVIERVAAEFAAPQDEVAADVREFMADLVERGWLQRV